MTTLTPSTQGAPNPLIATEEPRRGHLLHASGLRKSFGGQHVLADVTVDLREGEVVLLRGDNGSGKTTLLNILTGALDADAGTLTVQANHHLQRIDFPRSWVQHLSPFASFSLEAMARKGVARTWQEIRLFENHTLLENLALASQSHPGENPAWAIVKPRLVRRQEQSVLETARADLARLGLAEREESRGDRVSLGQAKRVAIARAARAGARALFLDEPLAGLDAEGVYDVLALLRQLVQENNITLILVEHVFNIPVVLPLATTVWTLRDGRISVASPHAARDLQPEVRFDVAELLRALSDRPSAPVERRELPGGAALWTIAEPAAPGLEVEGLVLRRGARKIFGAGGGLTFRVPLELPSVLEAPNGWGKTTLLDTLAGLLPLEAGVARLNGLPVDGAAPWTRARRGLAYLQSRDNTFDNLTVKEALEVTKALPAPTLVQHLLGKHVSDLSGGERQRLAIACAFGRTRPTFALLDEPLSSLDASGIGELKAALRGMLSRCTTLVTLPKASAVSLRDPEAAFTEVER